MEYLLLAAISFLVSIASGLLGIGGAVLLIPAYMAIPPLVGMRGPDVKEITGMTSVQVFAASVLGVVLHHRMGKVDRTVVLSMGIPVTAASLAGALVSGRVEENVLLTVFAVMVMVSAVLLIVGRRSRDDDDWSSRDLSIPAAVTLAAIVGFFGGMVGAPGAFILAPLMMVLLRIPTRVTIGSSLGIVLMSSLAASVGKAFVGQIVLLPALAAVAGALPGVVLGARLSGRLQTRTLRWVLAALTAGIGIHLWAKIV